LFFLCGCSSNAGTTEWGDEPLNAPDLHAPRIFRPEPGDAGRPKRGLDEAALREQQLLIC
jgi:hypothetical protein